jgi:hypothetical protein
LDLKTTSAAALDDWLGPESWDSGEPEDEARFYRFVSEYAKEHGFSMDPNELRQLIARTVLKKGHPVGHPQLEAILDHLMSMGCILDFLQATGR